MVSQVVNGLNAMNFKVGDAISVMMPMTVEAVALYLGIIKVLLFPYLFLVIFNFLLIKKGRYGCCLSC